MKKIILFYSGIVYLICFIPSIISLFQLDFKFQTIFFFHCSLFGFLSVYFITKDKFIKPSLLYLGWINFFQIFSIVLIGVSYKFVLGSVFNFYISDAGDLVTKFTFKFYNLMFHVNNVEADGSFLIGINFISLFLFIKFMSLLHDLKGINKL